RTRRAVLSYASAAALQAVTLAASIVATPIVLRSLGEQRFGAWRVALEWLGHLGLLELGLGGALLALLARAVGKGDPSAVSAALDAGFRVFLRVGAAVLVCGVALALAIDRLVPVAPELVPDLRAACFVAAIVSAALQPLAPR